MTRINVPLDNLELAALVDIATKDRRHPREQAAWIIRRELERLGLLPVEITAEQPQPPTESPPYAKIMA